MSPRAITGQRPRSPIFLHLPPGELAVGADPGDAANDNGAGDVLAALEAAEARADGANARFLAGRRGG